MNNNKENMYCGVVIFLIPWIILCMTPYTHIQAHIYAQAPGARAQGGKFSGTAY